MIIKGLQKLTALDFPDRLACTVFSPGCNLRCPFCHNASLVLRDEGEPFPESEILELLENRRGKLDGVCFTGGEPLLQKDIGDMMRKVKDMGFLVKLDTNGSMPDRLAALAGDGLLDYVAMDIKNSPEKYPLTCGVAKLDMAPFTASKDFLLSGALDYEFRTTVVKELHTAGDICSAGEWIRGAKRWYLQCFKDSGDLISSGFTAPDESEMREMRELASEYADLVQLRGI